jgi:hypothetical protein
MDAPAVGEMSAPGSSYVVVDGAGVGVVRGVGAGKAAHYLQRQTRGPDVRAVPDKYAGGDSGD